ncbi:MAG: hypothetical protein GEU74_16825 [Nitriliruptorales bacterium]|nr:hypothetical protein [Nitriliruptorales bacterium]
MPDEPPVTDRELASLLDEAHGEQAAAQRSRRRWLRQQAQADARLTGVLLNASEARHVTTIRTTNGEAYTGTVLAVGQDFCAVGTGRATTYVRLAAASVVLPDAAVVAAGAADHRAGPLDTTFSEALAERATQRPAVAVEFQGPAPTVRGILAAVGFDVATLETEGRAGVAYVSLGSVAAVSFLASGYR